MPGCARRRGTSLGTSSPRSSRESDSVFSAALISSIRRLGHYFGYEVPDENDDDCHIWRMAYKECVMTNLWNCKYYAKELAKTCPGFNDEEFLRTLSSSGQRDSGRKKNCGG